jgi:hypothetical protein
MKSLGKKGREEKSQPCLMTEKSKAGPLQVPLEKTASKQHSSPVHQGFRSQAEGRGSCGDSYANKFCVTKGCVRAQK